MIRIEPGAWADMLAHAERTYPEECCGAMLGRMLGEEKTVTRAVALQNAHAGPRRERYEIRADDLLAADRLAAGDGLDLLGIYHSHPDHDAYFSETDLKHSCPWYSFVVLSVRAGRFHGAGSWRPDLQQQQAEPEPLIHPGQEAN